jgi:arginyl-tRNA synthetase
VITSDVRHAVSRALARAGRPSSADPGLRPTGIPGQYAASVALSLPPGPLEAAGPLAAALSAEPWISTAEVTGPGYVTITVTAQALAAVADRVTRAGPACVTSDALRGSTVPGPPPGDPLSAATWEQARAALAARLTARLAAAAGATVAVADDAERSRASSPSPGEPDPVAAAVSFAGTDAVLFSLARAVPGKPVRIDPGEIARHVPGNPAYAVRYAHARAASGVRWAASSAAAASETVAAAVPSEVEAVRWRPPADRGGAAWPIPSPLIGHAAGGYGGSLPREATVLALLDALSWLPERVAIAARRGRPDEFARYLEELASATIAALGSPGAHDPGRARAPGTGRLALAKAARTGLAAGLDLLGVSAPARL